MGGERKIWKILEIVCGEERLKRGSAGGE